MAAGNERRTRGPWALLSVVLAIVGVVALVIAVTGQHTPPAPASEPAEARVVAMSERASTPAAPPAPAAPRSEPPAPVVPVPAPVEVRIPAIEVSSELMDLGLNPDGTVEVPPPSAVPMAGWYNGSPAPGAVGPALLLGHVDSAEFGPGVFFDLGALRDGDVVEVPRADGSVAVFTVYRVETYPKAEFPTLEVYGNTDAAELRLVTCGGAFDSSAGSYEDNVVAYARLVSITPG